MRNIHKRVFGHVIFESESYNERIQSVILKFWVNQDYQALGNALKGIYQDAESNHEEFPCDEPDCDYCRTNNQPKGEN